MIIGNTDLANRVYVIAEVGGNHNGDPELAFRMVEAAAQAGANAVKFQTYKAETLVHPELEAMPLARKYFSRQFDRFKSLELDWAVYDRIIARCGELGIDFLTTPFDLEALDRLGPRMPAIKVASGDLTYTQLLRAAAATGKPVVVSTGMADMDEIATVPHVVPSERLALLHCVSVYPTPDDKANLGALTALARAFPGVTIGYSDHTIGIEAPLAAVAMGARIIEKHFTLDTRQELGDHRLSLEPDGMAAMVASIRRIEAMVGPAVKAPVEGEDAMRRMMRRGVYAARDLPAGHVLTEADLRVIRPTAALAPIDADRLLGRPLARAVAAAEALTLDVAG